MASELALTYVDHDGETSNVGFFMPDINAGNFTTQDTAMDTLRDAINGVLITNLQSEARIYERVSTGAGLPADGFAQRETKWLVQLQDDVTGEKYTRELPGANLDLLLANQDQLDLTAGAGLTLKNAIEAETLSKDGNAQSVIRVIHVGRNI